MNCSYFAIERRRTLKVIKKIKQKKTKTNTKQKYTNKRAKNTLHTLNEI